jgi:hypothetical protein
LRLLQRWRLWQTLQLFLLLPILQILCSVAQGALLTRSTDLPGILSGNAQALPLLATAAFTALAAITAPIAFVGFVGFVAFAALAAFTALTTLANFAAFYITADCRLWAQLLRGRF